MYSPYIIPLFIAGTILFVVIIFFLIAYLLVQKNKQNRFQIEKNKMTFDHENRLLRTRIEEQEKTLSGISREIHDNIGQVLSFMGMNLQVITRLAHDEKQLNLLGKSQELLRQVINDVRNISHSLNSDYIKSLGLADALQKEADHINAASNILCEFMIKGEYHPFAAEEDLLIYRIAQEAIHNVIKHAHASALHILLIYERDNFTLSVTDNGAGFNKDKIFELQGAGILNIFQRAKLLGGKIDIQTAPGAGCTITFRLQGHRPTHPAASLTDADISGNE
ncbi:sensor histidine kinase [Chitinophagaceae bacterium MMS25-I14]